METVRTMVGAAFEAFIAVLAERLVWSALFGVLFGGLGFYGSMAWEHHGLLPSLGWGLFFALIGFLGALLPEVFYRDE